MRLIRKEFGSFEKRGCYLGKSADNSLILLPVYLNTSFNNQIEMKNYSILLILLLICFGSTAQKKTSYAARNVRGSSHFYGYEFEYSYMTPKVDYLNTYLTAEYGKGITNVATVGLNLKYIYKVNRKGTADYNWNFDYFLPQTVTSASASSYTLKGYQWGTMMYGKDILHHSRHFDLILGGGFNVGKYKLNENNGVQATEFKNKFFAPKLTSEFRIILGQTVAIGARAEYQWDTTARSWSSSSSATLPGSRFSGTYFQAFIGFGWLEK